MAFKFPNAGSTSVFRRLYIELYSGKVYRSYGELKQAIIDYIRYYNEVRIKEKLSWLSPVEYRETLAA
ncbi:IS3 family transposase [Falseniella ignava]|uniref:Integrase catalytic domain-containing protein n=1 Tax=Falseniella ignava TaxID=137730 RepID=A0A2I1K4T7_9LACT|nr:hypothetical protein CYJ57_00350 [Falseniella ignava]